VLKVPSSRLLEGARTELREDDWREQFDEDTEQALAQERIDRAREQAGHEVYGGSE
jgi:hypothetical protein